MAAWTITDVRFIAPEFTLALVPDVTLDAWIVRAARRIDESIWGGKAIDGGAYMTAHLMVLSGVGPYAQAGGAGAGAAGAIQSVSVGQVSVTYSDAVNSVLKNQPTLTHSKYGLMFAELLAELMIGVAVL